MSQDYYSLLGVSRDAEADAIKRAYRKLAKDLHPDLHPGDKTVEAKFKAVNRAFDVLSDERKRALYNEFGEDGLREGFDPDRMRAYKRHQGRATGGGAAGGGGFSFDDLFGSGVHQNLNDLFGDLFDRQQAPSRVPGADAFATVHVDFASAVRGATIDVKSHPSRTEPLKIRVPAGVRDGEKLTIRGGGGLSPAGGPPGTLTLTIEVQPHKHFRREGDDLHVDLPVTVVEAWRGAKVRVPTIDGSVTLTVPAKSQAGAVLRLRGKGVARTRSEPGDLYVHLRLVMPKADDDDLDRWVSSAPGAADFDPRADVAL
jgi:curved DNA-binding protein